LPLGCERPHHGGAKVGAVGSRRKEFLDKICCLPYRDISINLRGAFMEQSTSSSKPDSKQGLAIAGLVCGIIAFLFIPPLFGALGIIFGAISWKAGNKLGMAATVISIAGLIIGMIVGAIVFTS
jgi:hypothetical protein